MCGAGAGIRDRDGGLDLKYCNGGPISHVWRLAMLRAPTLPFLGLGARRQ